MTASQAAHRCIMCFVLGLDSVPQMVGQFLGQGYVEARLESIHGDRDGQ